MNPNAKRISVLILRWTLGLVVLLQSVRFILSSSAAHFLARAGLPAWIRPALGGGEILATILFLVPYTYAAGSYALLVIFALAALLHILHGQYDVEGLLVYAAAVFACKANADAGGREATHDGR